MTLENKIELAISSNRIEGAKKLASLYLQEQHKAEWECDKRADYETIYYEAIEYTETQQDDEGNDVEVVKTKRELKLDAPSYEDWINETTVVSEAVYMTYEEYVENEKAKHVGMEDMPLLDEDEYNLLPTIKTSEVTKLVRPYIPLEVTDEMIQTKLEEFGYNEFEINLEKVNEWYEAEVEKLVKGVPATEKSTWTKQETEARSWLTDNTVPTPLIDSLCEARGVDKVYLVGKIVEKADAYAVVVGSLTGLRQKQEDELLAQTGA